MVKLIMSIVLFVCCIIDFIMGHTMYDNQRYTMACSDFFFSGFCFVAAVWTLTEYMGA